MSIWYVYVCVLSLLVNMCLFVCVYIYIQCVCICMSIYIYIYIPERQWVRRLRTVSTCVLCRCSLSSWRFQKYFVFWVKMHIAWFLLDGVVCFARMCAELDGIEFVGVCVCLLVVFFALHNFTRVRWGGLGWGWWVRKIPPCPNGKNATHCQRVPQLEENMCKIHWLCTTILWVYTHIYIYAQDGGFAVGWTWKFLIKSFANDLVSEHVFIFFSGLKQSRGAMFSTPLVRSLRNCARAFITVARPGFPCKAAAAITSTIVFVRSFVEYSLFVLASQGSNIFSNTFNVATSSTSSTQQHLQHLHRNNIFSIATSSK